ncbi:Anti-sigma regulatory factor (Ser/Thr protein kinase) [Polaromonas sp. OV174]|uniref:ATP-binding protein n=1 Tax=Polaromonas sp. OV174 TaxID=1855300 RepID=UPI0008E88205|nr:ATP-binding protein [Polaromonas sp. OV174]SFC24801.1 Anti-sigma regulatory factor (Ser/Thr protein kinase) [Polaromonas sp. OV174]
MTGCRTLPTGASDSLACGAELANLPALLAVVAALCHREQIDEPTCYDLQIIVEEACVNVMHYAYPAGQSGPLTLAVQIAHHGGPRRIVVTLEDQGQPFDPLAVAPVDASCPVEARALGGLGVHLIRRLSDRQHYQRHPVRGNVFTIEKHLMPVPPSSH